jgi:hypothetical protein
MHGIPAPSRVRIDRRRYAALLAHLLDTDDDAGSDPPLIDPLDDRGERG